MTLSVRPARADDHAAFARLFVELAVDDPVPTLERWTRDMASSSFIADDDGAAVGYAYFQVLDGAGYLRHLATAPHARRVGVGRALMTAVSEHLRAHGAREWHLNVKPNNEAARRLYEAFGMRPQYESRQMRFEWSALASLPSPEPGVTARPIEEDEEARVETTLGLPAGLLRDARARGRILTMLEEPETGNVVGVSSFDTGIPGSFPFRVVRPALARNLLDALEPKRDRAESIMNVVVENDDALAKWLTDAGFFTRMEIVHYAGPL